MRHTRTDGSNDPVLTTDKTYSIDRHSGAGKGTGEKPAMSSVYAKECRIVCAITGVIDSAKSE